MERLATNSKIFIAGHNGMVGSAVVRLLLKNGFNNLLLKDRAQLNLTSQMAVQNFFEQENPEYVIFASAKVGGIHANDTFPAEFIYENVTMEANVIHHAWKANVKQLIFLGSSCIYPKFASQPICENELLNGALEPTNEPYAIAKITGIKLCEAYNRQYSTDFRSLMPTNLYGQNDNFHPKNSHVVPALIRRFHEAKLTGARKVEVWGTGSALREFLYVDDLAEAIIHTMQIKTGDFNKCTSPQNSHMNVGTGKECSISELALLIADVVGYQGEIKWLTEKPDGAPRKLLDVSKINKLGWSAGTPLKEGLENTYQWFLENSENLRT